MSLPTLWNLPEQPSSSTAAITAIKGWATACCTWLHRDKGITEGTVFLKSAKSLVRIMTFMSKLGKQGRQT